MESNSFFKMLIHMQQNNMESSCCLQFIAARMWRCKGAMRWEKGKLNSRKERWISK